MHAPGNVHWSAEVLIDWPLEDRTVAEAWSLGEEAHSLLHAVRSGELTQANALDLLRGGKWDFFREQPESEWLEAKQAPYLGSNDVWKHELAKDVASFANRPEGGVIVLGMRTEREDELDVVKEVNQIDLGLVSAERYRKVIGGWVYPGVQPLRRRALPRRDRGARACRPRSYLPNRRAASPSSSKAWPERGRSRDHYILLPFRRADETAFRRHRVHPRPSPPRPAGTRRIKGD